VPSGDRVLFVVADVAGKSIPAAMLMATFQASLRTLSDSGAPLTSLLSGLNRYCCANSQGGARFTTAFFGELDPATGNLLYVNAGHNAPVVRRASGIVERLEAGGLPLGIMPDTVYASGSANLGAGDWLVIFTDGVIEAVNGAGEEYGEPRLVRLIDSASNATPAELLRRLLADLDAYVGNTPQHDDMTCLLLKKN
jgi:serine phosphatase RsbU (regulator of sigma subunit)